VAGSEMEKLIETISFRVSEDFKTEYEAMSSKWKSEAKKAALLAIAKTIHESKFDAKLYLGDE